MMDDINDIEQLLENCKRLDRELEAMEQAKSFLLNEYKTNKRWFRDEPGRVTTEDVLKAAFEFGWASAKLFHENDQH